MQLKKVQHYFRQFEAYLSTPEAEDRLFIWESQRYWQENWEDGPENMLETYQKSLDNTKTRRLWKRESFEPKRMMELFIQLQPDFVGQMFKDLFNEEKSVDGRMDRFVFYADQLLEEYRNQHPHSIENNHYHNNDYDAISLYLSFRYPEQYAPYELARFQAVLRKLGVANLPQANDTVRFFKVMRTLFKLMQKEEGILEKHARRISSARYYQGDSLLLVHDFCCFLTEKKYSHFWGELLD